MAGMTPLTYQILLALADGDRHGYGIIKEIEERSGAGAAPSTGALYLALQRIAGDDLIAESPERPSGEDDARRRYYRLTEVGALPCRTGVGPPRGAGGRSPGQEAHPGRGRVTRGLIALLPRFAPRCSGAPQALRMMLRQGLIVIGA